MRLLPGEGRRLNPQAAPPVAPRWPPHSLTAASALQLPVEDDIDLSDVELDDLERDEL